MSDEKKEIEEGTKVEDVASEQNTEITSSVDDPMAGKTEEGDTEIATSVDAAMTEEAEGIGSEDAPQTVEVPMSGFAKVDSLTESMVRMDHPDFRPGDTVKVHVKIIEGNKERIQVFEGVVIAIKHGGIDKTFTVRKNSWGVGVERTFFASSPKIEKIEITRRGRVRRAKLYYLRERAGKSARIAEKTQSLKKSK